MESWAAPMPIRGHPERLEGAAWRIVLPRADVIRSRPHRASPRTVTELNPMVPVVVSIRARKMFAEVRKMFSDARHAEQGVREMQASRNF